MTAPRHLKEKQQIMAENVLATTYLDIKPRLVLDELARDLTDIAADLADALAAISPDEEVAVMRDDALADARELTAADLNLVDGDGDRLTVEAIYDGDGNEVACVATNDGLGVYLTAEQIDALVEYLTALKTITEADS